MRETVRPVSRRCYLNLTRSFQLIAIYPLLKSLVLLGMTASLRAGKIVTLPTVGLFADGAAVKTVGKETFNVCHQLVDEMITVQTGDGHYDIGFHQVYHVI